MPPSPYEPAPPARFGPDFLRWLREATEARWSTAPEWSIEQFRAAGIAGALWRRGTRWVGGLDEPSIVEIEARYGVRFGAQHRLFLRTLHATTPLMRGASWGMTSGHGLEPWDPPGFYDWTRDEGPIREVMARVVDGLVSDDLGEQCWHHSWGRCPTRLGERRRRIAALVAAAPALIPISGHRFVVAGKFTQPVLSVAGDDVIVYGRDLREYLLAELSDVLGIELPGDGSEPPAIPFWQHVIEDAREAR